MGERLLFRKIVKILSADEFLIKEIRDFVESLGILLNNVIPLIEKYERGHCSPDALMEFTLSKWISKQGAKATLAELTRILLEMENKACAEKLQDLQKNHPGPIKLPNKRKHSSSRENDSKSSGAKRAHCSRNPPPEETKPIIFGIRNVVLNFIGRDTELKKLQEYFHSEEPFVVISGLGGIGKTELTKKFALTATLPDTKKSIVKSWLSGESPPSLISSTAEFCRHLNLIATDSAGKPLEMETMLKNIMIKLKSSEEFSKWLVVIDNVDETHEQFQTAVKILHGFSPDVFLLVTSRRRDIYAGESELLELTTLKLKDSMEFVKQSLKITDNYADESIKSLCLQLDNFSLALTQAVAYIKQQQRLTLTGNAYGVQNYLDELSKMETAGLDKDLRLAEYPKATLKVWHITLDKIKECHGADGAMALDLLDVMAFINPDRIHLQHLCKLFPFFYAIEEVDMDQTDSCLKILLQYSLISSCDSVMNIHRLVQLAVRTRMATTIDQNNAKRKDVELLKTFWTSFNSKEWPPNHWKFFRVILISLENEMTHVLKIWNYSRNHLELDVIRSSRVKVVFDALHNYVGNEIFDFASEGCELMLKFYGAESKEYFQMVLRRGIAFYYKHEYEASFEKLTFVYDKLKHLCGEDDADILEAEEWIAKALRGLEKYEESLEWEQKTLQSKIRIYGENQESTIETKRDLAGTLRRLGRREEEMKMRNEILEWQEVHYGKYHLFTIGTRRTISSYFLRMGMYSEAIDVFQKVLSIQEERFEVDHRETLYTKKELADTLEKMGKIEEALKIYEEMLIAYENVNEPDYFQNALRERVRQLKGLVKIKKNDGAELPNIQ